VPNTYVSFTANSTNDANLTEYTIPFKFLNAEDIKVRSINTANEAVLQWIYVPIATWNTNLVDGETSYPFGYYSIVFENGVDKIKFSPVRPLNSLSGTGFQEFVITIYRRTATTNSTYFSNGSPIQASDLNAILLQSLYNSEEALEGIDSVNTIDLASKLNLRVETTGDTLTGSLNFSNVGSLTQIQGIQLNASGGGAVSTPRVVLTGGTIQNVPTPALDSDAVNKAYVDGLTLNGGSAPVIADDSITETLLRKVVGEEAVTTATIRPFAVTNIKLGSGSVTPEKLSNNSVIGLKIATGAVTSAKLGASAVTSVAINDGAVLEAKIGTGAVTNTKLGANSVTADKILDGTITSAKLANQTLIGSTVILDNSIPASKLQNSGITYDPSALNSTHSQINTTASTINAFNATINANKLYSKQTLTLNESNEVNAGTLTLASGSVKSDPNTTILPSTLNQFTGTIPELTFFTAGVNDGHYFYKIQAKNPNLLGNKFGRTLMKWQGRQGGQYGSNFNTNRFPTFFYKQIANIPFNYVVYNENPEISLVGTPYIPLTTSGEIVFNNSGNNSEKKFLITLTGFATTTRNGATLYIKPISDSYIFQGSPYTAPKSVISVIFTNVYTDTPDYYSYRTFSATTIFTLQAGTTVNFPVQYYYFDVANQAPPTNIPCGFGYGMESGAGISSTQVPPAWTGNLGSGHPNTWNESIVDLLIERIQ
jgi:hypothetical protein